MRRTTHINIIRRALLTLCLMVVGCAAWAQDPDVMTVEQLKEAVNSRSNVKLGTDLTLTETVTISKNITLDLNGHTLTSNGVRALLITGGDVTITSATPATIKGEGSIGENSSVIRVGTGSGAYDGSKTSVQLTIGENVTVSTEVEKCYGITVFGSQTTETLTVNGKVITKGLSAISGHGNAEYAGTTITIGENAYIATENDVAIYHPQNGKLTVEGTVKGAGGIEIKGGQLVVSDEAKITATTASPTHTVNNDGTSTRGYAIAIVENGLYAGVSTVNISPKANITGPIAVVKDSEKSAGAPVLTFDPTGIQMLVKVTTTEGGEEKSFGQYISFEQAMNEAPAGSTITLLADYKLAATLTTDKDFTLDLNGHTLTSDGRRAFDILSGNVTIKSTVEGGKIAVPTLADHESSAIKVGSDNAAEVSLIVAEGVTIAADESYGIIIAGKNTPQVLTVAGNVATKIRPAIAGENGDGQKATTITIASTAQVTTTDEVAIYQPQSGSLTIEGTVTGAGGVEIKGGTLAVGSTAQISATAAPAHVANNNGTSSRGYSVAIVENAAVNATGATAVSVDNAATLNGPVAQLQDSPVASFNPVYTGSAVSERVAAIGADKFFTLNDAINIVPSQGTVKLLESLTMTSPFVMDAEKTYTFDLDDKTLNGSNCAAVQVTHGHVTMTNGTITNTGTAPAALRVGSDEGGSRNVSLTLSNNTVVSSTTSVGVQLKGSVTRETLEVFGRITTIDHSAIVAEDEVAKITVATNAEVTASNAVAISQNNTGELMIDGKVTGTDAIRMKGGNLTVNKGAEVKATGKYAIAIIEAAGAPGVGKANISGEATITGIVACLVESPNTDAAEPSFTGDVYMVAETKNASSYWEKYSTLAHAIKEATGTNPEVKLLDNITVAETFNVAKSITLNMDDYSIIGNQSTGVAMAISADVTFQNGGINSEKDGISVTAGTVSLQNITVNTGGVSLTVNAGTVTADQKTTLSSVTDNTVVLSGGSLTVLGKVLNTAAAEKHAISAASNAALTIESTANVSSASSNAINWESTGALTINGGKIMGAEAVYANNGTVTINGGTFTGTGNAVEFAGGSTPSVKHGTFICGASSQPIAASSATGFVQGDFFSDKIKQTLCAEGYMVSKNRKNNGMYYLVDEIVINDGTSWSVPDETYVIGTARYVRNSGMGASGTQFGTLCLPFSFSSTQNGMTFYAVESISDDVLNLTKITGDNITAGTPVVFQFESATTGFTIESHNATISNAAATEANNLVGTFATQKLTSNLSSLYFLNGDAFHQAASSLTVPAYRAYIKLTSPSNRRVLYIHTDEAVLTGIDSAEQTDDVEAVYDLQGRQQSGLKAGMNVVKMSNGRTIKVYVNK